MTPLNQDSYSYKYSTSIKTSNVSWIGVELASKLRKSVQKQPSYDYAILSRPKHLNTSYTNATAGRSTFSKTVPVPVITKDIKPLANTIKSSAQANRSGREDAIEMSYFNNISWISEEYVIETEEVTSDTEKNSLTSVSWAMTASDRSVEDAAREWLKTTSLAKKRTYTHGSVTAKAIQKRRERIIKGYHPLCKTVRGSNVSYPYIQIYSSIIDFFTFNKIR